MVQSFQYSIVGSSVIIIQIFELPTMDRRQFCKICDNLSCGQSFDHERVTQEQFVQLFKSQAKVNIFITDIKNKIKRTLKTLQNRTLIQGGEKGALISTLIDQLQYWHLLKPLGSIKNIEAILFGYSLQKNKLVQMIRVLKKNYKQNSIFPSFRSLQRQLNYVLSPQFSNQQFGNPYDYLFQKLSKIISDFEAAELKIGDHQAHIAAGGMRSNLKPMTPEYNSLTETVLIEGIPMSIFKQTLNLSMLQVSSAMISKYIPAIEKMVGLKAIQLRNNRISQYGYKILFSALPCQNIQTLDLRNSSLPGKAISIICERMKNIENLYLSETNLHDRWLDMIGCSLKNLKVLHVDKNPISYKNVERVIMDSHSLLYISIKNTNLTKKQARQLARAAARINRCISFE